MRFFAAILFLLFVIPTLGLAQLERSGVTEMLDCSGLPCVDVVFVNGKHLKLLIDTGNVNSVIDTAAAQRMGLSTTEVTGRDGKPVAAYRKAFLPDAKLGSASLGEVKVLVMDLATYIKEKKMPEADGTLAYTAFKDRLLELDYRGRQVRVSGPSAAIPCSGTCGLLSTPTFGKNGPPILVSTGFLINDREVTAQIDTLFSGTFLVYPTSVDKLGLSKATQTDKKRFFNYTDDGVYMLEAQAKTEAFGTKVLARNATVYFATPEVHLPDGMFDATVGHELLQHSVVFLDLHNMKMWIS